MQKTFFLLFISCTCSWVFGQSASSVGVWLDHLPYSNGVDVVEHDNTIYCATEQGIFIYDNAEKTIERLSKINGLSDVGITTLGWAEKYDLLMVGYANGNVDMVEGSRVTNVPDIRITGNYTGMKRINQIEVVGDDAYICTNFGIVQYDIRRMVVRETFIIGPTGDPVEVLDVAFSPDSIYAATSEGLLQASLNDQLIDFGVWEKAKGLGQPINHVTYFNNRVFVNKPTPPAKDSIFYRQKNEWQYASELLFMANVLDLRVDKGLLLVSNAFSSVAYDTAFGIAFNFQGSATDNPTFSARGAAAGSGHSNYWVADGQGLYQGFKQGPGFYITNIQPNAPADKKVFKMHYDDERLLVAPGGMNDVWGPAFNNGGFYELQDFDWTNHPNGEFEGYQDIVAMITDPEDPTHFYASSYGNGILEFRNNQFERIINSETTGGKMTAMSGGGHRVGGFSADSDGNIWFTNSLTDHPLGVIRPDGSVEVFSLGSAVTSATAIKDILYTSQGQIWIQTRNAGIVAVDLREGVGRATRMTATEGSGNLPEEHVLSFAEDLDGEIWIGTNEGMAVLYSPQNIFEPNRNYDAQIIVIDEDGDGSGERVLGVEAINDIEVDGSNKKWFATGTKGVFYTSENGKEQIHRFTAENSPLPSNTVIDIEIDDVTGMVYFATDQGIVSFQGSATQGAESHTDVFAYPNPVEPGYEGPILIRGLVTNAQVKITDIEGNLIFETVAEGGQALWDGRNFSGQRAKSGVYLAYITNDNGSVTAVTKIMIVN